MSRPIGATPAATLDPAMISGLLGAAGMGAVLAGLGAARRARWIEPLGAAAHLALFPFASAIASPGWARALGYGWLAFDAGLSLELTQHLEEDRGMPARLLGHLAAAGWIAGSASRATTPLTRWLGFGAAATLGGHTFVSRLRAPPLLLVASGPLFMGWLASCALLEPRLGARRSIFR